MPLVATPTITIQEANPPDPNVSSSLIRVHDGAVWQELAIVSSIRIKKRVGGGQAQFFIPDASLAEVALLRTGALVEITYSVDGDIVVFGGYVSTPDISVRTNGHFDLIIKIEDLTHRAGWQIVKASGGTAGDTWATGTKFTDIIVAIFANSWGGVTALDTSGIVSDLEVTDEDYVIHNEYIGRAVDKIVKQFLPDWDWWIEHDGGVTLGLDMKVVCGPRGSNDRTSTIELTEDDVGPKFRLKPAVDPRGSVYTVGADDPANPTPGYDDRPLWVVANKAASNAAYGQRDLIERDPELASLTDLAVNALAIGARRNFATLQGRFRAFNWSLLPGDKILLYLPTIGIDDGVGGGTEWVVVETEDRYHQNRARRWATLRETPGAAETRVS